MRVEMKAPASGLLSPNGMVQFRRCEEEAMAVILSRLQASMRSRTPKANGTLTQSLLRRIDPPGFSGRGLSGRVFSPLKYAPVMEYGRSHPGAMPPDDPDADVLEADRRPIAYWLYRKGIADPEDDDFESRVFLVRRKIARSGFAAPHNEGWRFVRDTIAELRSWAASEFGRAALACLSGSETPSAGAIAPSDGTTAAGAVSPGDESEPAGAEPAEPE